MCRLLTETGAAEKNFSIDEMSSCWQSLCRQKNKIWQVGQLVKFCIPKIWGVKICQEQKNVRIPAYGQTMVRAHQKWGVWCNPKIVSVKNRRLLWRTSGQMMVKDETSAWKTKHGEMSVTGDSQYFSLGEMIRSTHAKARICAFWLTFSVIKPLLTYNRY